MAIYNEILAGRFSRLMQKVFSMKGGNPAKQLGGEVMPVFPLPNGAENRWPESWLLYGKALAVSAVAAQFSFVQLRNPLNSGVIAVVHKISMSEAQADAPVVSITNATQVDASIFNVFGLDSRNHGSSALILSQSTQVANPVFANGLVYQHGILANTVTDVVVDSIQEIPMLPGLTLRISANTVNFNLFTSIFWRERPIEESEAF